MQIAYQNTIKNLRAHTCAQKEFQIRIFLLQFGISNFKYPEGVPLLIGFILKLYFFPQSRFSNLGQYKYMCQKNLHCFTVIQYPPPPTYVLAINNIRFTKYFIFENRNKTYSHTVQYCNFLSIQFISYQKCKISQMTVIQPI